MMMPQLQDSNMLFHGIVLAACLALPFLYVSNVSGGAVDHHDEDASAHNNQLREVRRAQAVIEANQGRFTFEINHIKEDLEDAKRDRKEILETLKQISKKVK